MKPDLVLEDVDAALEVFDSDAAAAAVRGVGSFLSARYPCSHV